MAPPLEETAFVVCDQPLLTATPYNLCQTINKFDEMLTLIDGKAEKGTGTYVISTEQIDSGAILLYLYFAFRIHRQGWVCKFGGTGDALNDLANHIGHWAVPKQDRKELDCKKCDFLMRDITDRDQMVSEIEEWATHVKKATTAGDAQLALWKCQVGEVSTNSFQHGKASLMFLAGRSTSQGEISLAVLDFGETIPKTIRRHPDCPGSADKDNDSACIEFACKKGITSKSVPENQGSGLHGLIETAKKTGGSVQILSGSGVFHISESVKQTQDLSNESLDGRILDGTLVTMNLKI